MTAGDMSTSPGLPTPGHAAFEELTAGFALDALEPGEEELFLAHLPDCERCQDALIAHQEVAASLTYALPSSELPPMSPELAACVESKAQQLPLDPFVTAESLRRSVQRRSAPRIMQRPRGRVTRRVLVGAGALGIIAAIGLSSYDVQRRATPPTAAASSTQQLVQAITQRGATIEHLSGSKSTGSAVVSDGHAYLVAATLPRTGSFSSYVVWDVESAKPVALKRFPSSGTSTPQVVDLGAATSTLPRSYAVTLESGAVTAPLPVVPNASGFVLNEDPHTS